MPRWSEPDTRSRRPSDDGDPLIGTVLDERFRIEQRIATGGFGAIYRARTAAGELVALKILHPRLTGDPNMVARFQREGATLIQLHDPHTVATHEVGETRDGTLYIAMELLTGESLQDRLRRLGALPWRVAVAIASAVCSSLAEAHALGVVHRDLKPANIHVGTRGTDHDVVKVIDFGIVRIAPGSSIDDGQELTYAGHMIGTYDYMSPEQIVGAPCDGRSDIYSLGVVIYEMVTGRRPFPKVTSPASMMTALLTQTPIAPAVLAAIPLELDRLVMRCLEREPEHRFARIAELAAALDVLARWQARQDEATFVHPTRRPSAAISDEEQTWVDHDRGVLDGDASTVPHDATQEPATVRTVEPATVPAVEPATVRTVEPATVRTVEPATVRTVEPATVRTVEPATVRTVEPATVRTVEPATVPGGPPAYPVSLATTLRGVAVAPDVAHRGRRVTTPARPHPSMTFEAPAPRAMAWPPPAIPLEPLAGSARDPTPTPTPSPSPARSYGRRWLWLWLAFAIASITAIVLAAVL